MGSCYITQTAQPSICDNLEGWDVEGRFKMEGTYVYLWLIHVLVWQKPTPHCKAIIIQLKINVKNCKKKKKEKELSLPIMTKFLLISLSLITG